MQHYPLKYGKATLFEKFKGSNNLIQIQESHIPLILREIGIRKMIKYMPNDDHYHKDVRTFFNIIIFC